MTRMLIKIAQWPTQKWKSETFRSRRCLAEAHADDGPRCAGLKGLLCPPSVVPISVVLPTGDKVTTETPRLKIFKDARVSHHDIVRVIFGARLSYGQITSSSVSLAWMCSRESARDDTIPHGCLIIQVHRVKGNHQV